MKFPSISSLVKLTRSVFVRFPLQIIITITAVITAWLLTESRFEDEEPLIRLLCFCLLALTSSLSALLYSESGQSRTLSKWLFQILAIIVSACIMLWLRPELWQKDIYVFLMMALAFHLLVAYAPFLNHKPVLSFWHFNKTLFLQFLTAALYSGVIILGLFAALAAIDNLFDVTIRPASYAKVAATVGFGFNTIYFLSGIPENQQPDTNDNYPKGLKIFTQYVLIPLMTVYLVILFAYELKIIMEWELPKGYVSILILAYAVFGILSLLLVYPIRNMEENKWIKLFSKFFYIMMLPLLVLLALAIYKRISDYGITEERYILIALAIWLTGITFYFLFSKKDNIKIIPISLTVFCLLSAFGPQSAASISKLSQTNRLKALLKNQDSKNKSEIASVLNYLVENHGLTVIQSFTEKNVVQIQNTILSKNLHNNAYQSRSLLVDTAFALLKIKELKSVSQYYSRKKYKVMNEDLLSVSGFETAYQINSYANTEQKIQSGQQEITISKSKDLLTVSTGNEVVSFALDSICKNIANQHKDQLDYEITLPDSNMQVSKESTQLKLSIKFINFSLAADEDMDRMDLTYTGYLLIHKK